MQDMQNMNVVARALAIALSAFLLCSCTLKGTPRDSLSLLRTALLNHDADEAMKYIDVDSIVDHLVKERFARRAARAKSPSDALKLEAEKGIASATLPFVKELLARQVRKEIESGGESDYFDYIRKGSVWYLTIDEQDETATVTPKGGNKKVQFVMKKTDQGCWKIIEVRLRPDRTKEGEQ
jgi:hypothetical protein